MQQLINYIPRLACHVWNLACHMWNGKKWKPKEKCQTCQVGPQQVQCNNMSTNVILIYETVSHTAFFLFSFPDCKVTAHAQQAISTSTVIHDC